LLLAGVSFKGNELSALATAFGQGLTSNPSFDELQPIVQDEYQDTALLGERRS
jgi:hypothetical protein